MMIPIRTNPETLPRDNDLTTCRGKQGQPETSLTAQERRNYADLARRHHDEKGGA